MQPWDYLQGEVNLEGQQKREAQASRFLFEMRSAWMR
jgi:hypothetical protein